MKIKQHCWHYTGITLTVYPAIMPQYCCWCRAIRSERGKLTREGHGEYLERQVEERFFTEPDRECVERDVPSISEEGEDWPDSGESQR